MSDSEPIKLRVTSACPACQERYVMDVVEVLEAKPLGTYSLAGAQSKVAATSAWKWICTACRASGRAAAAGPFLPPQTCGHNAATLHYPVPGDHEHCPGCCPICIDHHRSMKVREGTYGA